MRAGVTDEAQGTGWLVACGRCVVYVPKRSLVQPCIADWDGRLFYPCSLTQAFSSYLLIAWVSTNVIFVAAATILSNSTWESCAMTESEMAVRGPAHRTLCAFSQLCSYVQFC